MFNYILVGFLGGVLGGMGMGGGTVLIPLLTVFCGVDQKAAQAINLVSFVPMAIVAVTVHLKRGRIKKKGLLSLILPAAFFSAVGSAVAGVADSLVLRRAFGVFLLFLAVFSLFGKNRKQPVKQREIHDKNDFGRQKCDNLHNKE